MTADDLKLNISGKLAYSDTITVAQATRIITFIVEGAAGDTDLGLGSQDDKKHQQRRDAGSMANPREALDKSQAKTNPERIVALALYVTQDGAKGTFTLEDVKPLFRRARASVPGNISRDMDVAIRAGWVHESETSGEFYVTSKAENVLDTGFEALRTKRSAPSRARSGSTKKTRTSSTEVPEVFKELDEIAPLLDGFGAYHKLKTKTDKFLWAVNYAKVNGVPTISAKELVWLTDRLGDGIITGDMSGNFRQNHKAGYVNRSTQDQKFRITPTGETYLKSKLSAA